MSKYRGQIILAISLLILSVVVYFFHYYIFRDPHHIFIYMIGDIAFVFIEVLLVTLIIHRLLTEHEKHQMLKKLNMVIGAFYSEVGSDLMHSLSEFNQDLNKISKQLSNLGNWSDNIYITVSNQMKNQDFTIHPTSNGLLNLKKYLVEKRKFLLRLLENQNLLEHETFTDLLWAVFHLTEELENRTNFNTLPESDISHIEGDIRRAYGLLIAEWLIYMRHLKDDYPYLFSLAMRTNPFNPRASVIVS